MNSHPSISIIIPTLQEEKLISKTLGQFTPELKRRFNIEVIVSDGGSTDGTLAVARSIVDSVIESSPNVKQNIAIGRNWGARRAQGQLLIFLDADVRIENPEYFFDILLNKLSWRKYVAATCDVSIYPEEEEFLDRIMHGIINRYFWFLNFVGMGMGRGECQIVPRDVFDRSGGFNESLPAGEDYDLFLRLRRAGKIAFLRNLSVYESPRRYRKSGYLRVYLFWFMNALSILFSKRAIVDEWKPVR